LVQIQSSGEIFGYVRYVLPNTSASENGVERGMIFNSVDGQVFTENNYNELLSQTTYTIDLATLNGSELVPTGESITLVKEQYSENPVFIQKTFDIDGQKIGYLMYNAFTNEYDSQLNAAFANFKGEGVTDLVLDLRYNGGGSIETANDLSSMITGQFTGQLFVKEVYNENFETKERFFNNKIGTGEMISSLNLNRVYILTTGSTASASELVISGLLPYIDVVQIGTSTTGKFQGSTLIYDSPDFSRQNVNLCHHYAMLPLILKSVNADGFTDYAEGIAPDIELQENLENLGVLGETSEPLLNAALNQIIPGFGPGGKPVPPSFEYKIIDESGTESPLYQRMIIKQTPQL
jgi:C-terminal processing protease CtpA/Prc